MSKISNTLYLLPDCKSVLERLSYTDELAIYFPVDYKPGHCLQPPDENLKIFSVVRVNDDGVVAIRNGLTHDQATRWAASLDEETWRQIPSRRIKRK